MAKDWSSILVQRETITCETSIDNYECDVRYVVCMKLMFTREDNGINNCVDSDCRHGLCIRLHTPVESCRRNIIKK